MLKYQMGLIALLIGCFAFISCDIIQEVLTPAVPEEETMPDANRGNANRGNGYRRHDA